MLAGKNPPRSSTVALGAPRPLSRVVVSHRYRRMASLLVVIGIVVVLVTVMAATHSLRRIADAQEAAVQHLATIERRLGEQDRGAGSRF
jgi:sensor domain CHASE-containing protein